MGLDRARASTKMRAEEAPQEEQASVQADEVADTSASDDTWADGLTQIDLTADTPADEPKATTPTETVDDTLEKQRLQGIFKSLETVDADVAEELYNRVVLPELERHLKSFQDKYIKQLDDKVTHAQRAYDDMLKDTTSRRMSKVNKQILEKYPKAQAVLQSREFMDFVNSQAPRYATELPYDLIRRAYTEGDAEFVMGYIEQFANSRSKPSIPVEVASNSTGETTAKATRKMSVAEYQKKRKEIMSAPRGTYPANALADLVKQYQGN